LQFLERHAHTRPSRRWSAARGAPRPFRRRRLTTRRWSSCRSRGGPPSCTFAQSSTASRSPLPPIRPPATNKRFGAKTEGDSPKDDPSLSGATRCCVNALPLPGALRSRDRLRRRPRRPRHDRSPHNSLATRRRRVALMTSNKLSRGTQENSARVATLVRFDRPLCVSNATICQVAPNALDVLRSHLSGSRHSHMGRAMLRCSEALASIHVVQIASVARASQARTVLPCSRLSGFARKLLVGTQARRSSAMY
jgi:hypothetical protein